MGRKKKTQDWTSLTQEDVVDRCAQKKFNDRQQRAKSSMDMRTKNHDIFSKISHMQNIYPLSGNEWSEGSTQAIKRKIRAQTIQRVPDGEIVTQFDKNSIEQIEIEFIFKHKILTSEYDGKDMLKNIWRAFNYSYDYGFACVRSGFEKDLDGRITALKTNMSEVNRLKTDILNLINDEILALDTSDIGIPLGSLFLPELFSGKGPAIPVRILSIRNSDATFSSKFSQAGINQTLHQLTMIVSADVAVLVLGQTSSFTVNSEVVVAETVIVGDVPSTFLQTGGNYESKR